MRTGSVFLVLVLSLLCVPAVADTVTPNDRVETRLRVREQPNGDSTIVGFLAVGASAELTSDVPHWYEIELTGGTPGFVSKGFARVIPDVGPAQVLRLGGWNIKKLGHNNGKDYPLTASIIEDNFDVVAVVEVMQAQGNHPGYDQLLAALGPGWQGVVTDRPRPNTNSGSAEFYAVYFRPQRARLCNAWTGLHYHVDNDGSSLGTGADNFAREPAFVCLVAGGFDFVLAPYHATWSDGDIDVISDEADELGDVFAAMAAAQSGERDLLVIGDFNLVPEDLEEAIGREVPTVGTGSTLNGTGARTGNLYDHLLVFDGGASGELIGTAEVIDVRSEAANNKTFFDEVSDHLPIVARFNVAAADDD